MDQFVAVGKKMERLGTLGQLGWLFLAAVYISAVFTHNLTSVELVVLALTGNVLIALSVTLFIVFRRTGAAVVEKFLKIEVP